MYNCLILALASIDMQVYFSTSLFSALFTAQGNLAPGAYIHGVIHSVSTCRRKGSSYPKLIKSNLLHVKPQAPRSRLKVRLPTCSYMDIHCNDDRATKKISIQDDSSSY